MPGFDSGYVFTNIITGSGITNFNSDIQTISRDYIATTNQLSSSNITGFSATARAAARNTAGDVLKMVVVPNVLSQEWTQQSPTSASPLTIFQYSYTPIDVSSTLLIKFDAQYYINGSLNDKYRTNLRVDGTTISTKFQQWFDFGGGGTRSSTMFPISAVYTNSNTTSKIISVQVFQDGSDDWITVYDDGAAVLQITEIKR
jgi:hypothetical protein